MTEQTHKSSATNPKNASSRNTIGHIHFSDNQTIQKKEPSFFEKTPSDPFFNSVKCSSQVLPVQKKGRTEKASIQKKENATGLPDTLKSGIENLSGYSLDDVKVHRNSSKPAQLQAKAYAQGTDIHLGPGQEKHLPHEAWHVVQQKQGRVKPTKQLKRNLNVNDDVGLEQEADAMARKAISQNGSDKGNGITTAGNEISNSATKPVKFQKSSPILKGNTIQRICGDNNAGKFTSIDKPQYGVLINNSGSCMDTLLNPGSSGGSKVTSFPNYWPAKKTHDRIVLHKYMVQGHFWNKDLGGPGNTRDNLTPITISANGQHNSKVESKLKKDLKTNTLAHYVVRADYSAPPKASEIAPGNAADQAIVQKYVANMAKGIHAEYTIYDALTLQQKKYESWKIGNEHATIT